MVKNNVRKKMFRWLGLPGNSSCLLVFDDSDSLSLDKIRDFVPAGDGGPVVVTTRRITFCQLGFSFPVQKLPLREAKEGFKSDDHLVGDLRSDCDIDIEISASTVTAFPLHSLRRATSSDPLVHLRQNI
jgi:hypothetical protein